MNIAEVDLISRGADEQKDPARADRVLALVYHKTGVQGDRVGSSDVRPARRFPFLHRAALALAAAAILVVFLLPAVFALRNQDVGPEILLPVEVTFHVQKAPDAPSGDVQRPKETQDTRYELIGPVDLSGADLRALVSAHSAFRATVADNNLYNTYVLLPVKDRISVNWSVTTVDETMPVLSPPKRVTVVADEEDAELLLLPHGDAAAAVDLVIGQGVTRIRTGALRYCARLESLSLPADLKTIDDGAFFGCKALKTVTIDEKNEVFAVIDGRLIEKESGRVIFDPNA